LVDDARVRADDEVNRVVVTLTRAEAVALREVVSFADFNDALEARDPAEATVVSALLTALDPLIPELGTDAYSDVLHAAWREINARR